MICITRPLPRYKSEEGKALGPRIVVMVTGAGLRMQRCATNEEAICVERQWRVNDFRYWPGELRRTGA